MHCSVKKDMKKTSFGCLFSYRVAKNLRFTYIKLLGLDRFLKKV
jgi:hypothetical protein